MKQLTRQEVRHVALSIILFFSISVAQAVPRIDLKPAFSHLQSVNEEARLLEPKIIPLLESYYRQKELYKQSQCEGRLDQGCLDIKQAATNSYMKFLNMVRDQLDKIEPALKQAINSMQPEMRKIGYSMTPLQLHDQLGSAKTASNQSITSEIRKRRTENIGLIKSMKKLAATTKGKGNAHDKQAITLAEYYDSSKTMLSLITEINTNISSQLPFFQTGFTEIFNDDVLSRVDDMRSFVLGDEQESPIPIPEPNLEEDDFNQWIL